MSRCPTCGRKQKRSTDQNARYWALLARMSIGLAPGGRQYGVESYHLHYRKTYLGCKDYELPNGQPMSIPLSTTELDEDEFSAFLTKVEVDAAERGIYLEE